MTQTAVTNDKPKPSALGTALANVIKDHLEKTLGAKADPEEKPEPLVNRYKLPSAPGAKVATNKASAFKLPKAEG